MNLPSANHDGPNETLDSVVPPVPPLTVQAHATSAFGEYEVLNQIGQGGMGRVHKARDSKLERFVAIKELLTTDAENCERLRTEAKTIAKLRHPNIVEVFAIGSTADNRPYIVMEYADGGSLDKELDNKPFNQNRAAELLEKLARAVHFAHEQGVIHRDLKPANVLRIGGVHKITDFGLAKQLDSVSHTRSGMIMGTPAYMSPEQAGGRTREIGPATDIHALGAILYEMLTGRAPFGGDDLQQVLGQVLNYDPASPSRLVPWLKRDLVVICLKCLEKVPARRYTSAEALADDLLRFQNGQPILARPASRIEKLWRWMARHPWEAATLAASALAVALLIAGAFAYQQSIAKAREQALRTDAEGARADAKIHELQTNNQAGEKLKLELSKQAETSLKALEEVRDRLLESELSGKPELRPLHEALSKYYTKLLSEDLKDRGYDRAELAKNLLKVGELFRKNDDRVKARAAYESAAKVCGDSSEEKARQYHAEAQSKIAEVLLDQSAKGGPAEEALNKAETLWTAAREYNLPDAADRANSELGEVWHLRGQLYTQRREFKDAEKAYDRAIDYRAPLAARVLDKLSKNRDALAGRPDPDRKRDLKYLRDLGRGYGFRGDVLREQGKQAAADKDYWESHHIRETVQRVLNGVKAPATELADAKLQLAYSWANFADMYSRTGALGTALYFANESLKLHKALATEHPANNEYKSELWGRVNSIAELKLLTGKRAEQFPELERIEDLPEDDTSKNHNRSRGMRGALATTLALRATDKALAGDTRFGAEAASALALFDDLITKLEGATKPEPSHWYYKAAMLALLSESDDAQRAKRRADALDALTEAAKLEFRNRHPDDIARFRAFQSLKDEQRFKELLDQLRAQNAPKK